MTRLITVAILAVLLSNSCFEGKSAFGQTDGTHSGVAKKAEHNPLAYECLIPDELKTELLIRQKDGTATKADAHALYRSSHSEGWYAVFNCYASTGLTESKGLHPLPVRQETRFTSMAREIGATEAKAALLKMELAVGTELLGRMVAREMTSSQMKAFAPSSAPKPAE